VFIYWLFFLTFSLFSVNPIKFEKNTINILRFFFLFILSIFIGLRFEVGGDWDIYLNDFNNNIKFFDFFSFSYVRDFGYEFISYIFYNLRFGIYGVNLSIAVLFVYSLHKFAINLDNENYSLIFLVSLPYLIVVVSMGYTRQAAALSFILLSICSFQHKKNYSYVIYLLLAILFHKSSVVMIPIIFISQIKYTIKNFIILLFLSYIAFLTIYPEITRISSGYFSNSSKYVSQGVYFRIVLNLFSGLLFILFYRFLKHNNYFDRLIFITIFINFLMIFLINAYSTFVDRLMIYFTFIQLMIFSRMYLIYPKLKIIFNLFVIIIYFIVFYLWLNFANHSFLWIPYKNILIEVFK